MKKFNIIPYFVSMKGCDRRCIYCNQFSMKGHEEKRKDIIDFVLKNIEFYKDKENIELAFYGGTFFNLPEKEIEYIADKIIELKDKDIIKRARCSTTPDSINKKTLERLKGVIDTVELGIQSLDDYILKIIGRRYLKKDVLSAKELLKYYGYKVGFQLMIGLPFESKASHIYSTNLAIEIKPDFVRLYPLFIPKRTPLSTFYRLGFFKPISFDELLWRLSYSICKFSQSNIEVIKIGLNEFIDDKDIDFIHRHNDLRGAVMTNIFRKLLSLAIEALGKRKEINILCNQSDYHYVIGINRENILFFKKNNLLLKVRSGNIKKYHLMIEDRLFHIGQLTFSLQ